LQDGQPDGLGPFIRNEGQRREQKDGVKGIGERAGVFVGAGAPAIDANLNLRRSFVRVRTEALSPEGARAGPAGIEIVGAREARREEGVGRRDVGDGQQDEKERSN